MTFLFNRKVELQVGKAGEEGRIFSDLRIEFDVDKNRESNANSGKVSIYNLNPQSRNLVNDEGQKYQLKAGYDGLGNSPIIGVLSSGDVLEVETVRRGADIITQFKIGEATKALSEKTLDKSYEEGTSIKAVVNDMADQLEVAKGAIKGLKDLVFNSGYSATGKIKDRLDELTNKQDLEWSVQNGELQILPKDGSTDELAILLTKDTGLLKAYKAKSEKGGSTELKDVIRFEALLNPDIKIGRKVRIVSEINEIDEYVTVKRIKYMGDNKDGAFKCIGEAS